jgi:hypothetical protein
VDGVDHELENVLALGYVAGLLAIPAVKEATPVGVGVGRCTGNFCHLL